MLYVTTRNHKDAYTANRALCEMRGPDGGVYVPFRAPKLSDADIDALDDKSFNTRVADTINLLFNTQLSCWDVDFCVGRRPVRLSAMSHRIVFGECWHNPEWDISYMVRGLANKTRAKGSADDLGDWPQIGVRIAILFGIFGELQRAGIASRETPVDVSVLSGDFAAPMAAWYARAWGLPIGNIVCCCNENHSLWELLHHGELRTGNVAVRTSIPDADVALPTSLERLVHACGGYAETYKYVNVCRRGGVYRPNDVILSRLRGGVDVSVVSAARMNSAIINVYRTHQYLMGPYTALCYTGLLDYRARTGESRYSLILSEKSPSRDIQTVAAAMGISETELQKEIDKN